MPIRKTTRRKDEVGSRSRIGLLQRIIFGAVLMLLATPLRADDIGDLQSKFDAWMSKCKDVYRLDCDDMKQIWTAYCLDYDVAVGKDREAAREVADKMKEDAQSAIESQLGEYDNLKSDAERLKTGSTEEQATKILDAMNTEADKLKRLKNKGAWLGSNNPLIQYAINYGISKHQEMGGSSDYKCAAVPKTEIPGGSGSGFFAVAILPSDVSRSA